MIIFPIRKMILSNHIQEIGNIGCGSVLPSRGRIYDIQPYLTSFQDSLLLNFLYQNHQSDLKAFIKKFYLNGIWQGETNDLEFLLSNYRENYINRLDTLASLKNEIFTETDWMKVSSIGSRIHLSWIPATTSDLAYQRIYYDAGIAGRTTGDFELLDTVPADGKEYETMDLTDNITYRFLIRSVDRIGNEKANNNIVSILLNQPPRNISNFSKSFNSSKQIITFSWSASPDANDADFAGYLIFDNWIENQTLGKMPELNRPRVFITGLSYEYPFNLFSGDWIFEIRSVDIYGNISVDTEQRIYFSLDSNFNEIAPLAKAPTGLSGYALPGGKARLFWYGQDANIYTFRIDYSTDLISWAIADDKIIESRTNSLLLYTLDTPQLIVNKEQNIYFRVRSQNGSGRFENNNNTIKILLDDLPPENPTSLKVELIG